MKLRILKTTFTVLLITSIIQSCGDSGQSKDEISSRALKTNITTLKQSKDMKRVTGIGGIFFKSKDPEKMREWYNKHLGLVTNEYGSLFEFRSTDQPDQKGYLQWSPFTDKTKYFEPSKKSFMINYRVENLEKLIEELIKEGVEIVGEIETYEYGKFAHVLDLEGNKIELWEPVDSVFTKMYEGKTTH